MAACDMVKNYKQIVEDAQKHSGMARESSDRHSQNLSEMKRVADDAAENLRTSRASLRKRDGFAQAADRRSDERETRKAKRNQKPATKTERT